MKNYKVHATVSLTIAADNKDALVHLLQEMDYKFTHIDAQSEIVDTKLLDIAVVGEY